MGFSISGIFERLPLWRATPKRNIIITGLDAAGSSTLLHNHLRQPGAEVAVTIPIIGLNVSSCQYKHNETEFSLVTWCSFEYFRGERPFRIYRESYMKDAVALIFVVDSNDRKRIENGKVYGALEHTLRCYFGTQDDDRAQQLDPGPGGGL